MSFDISASWGTQASPFSILVHGGAGDVPEERRAAHRAGCAAAVAGAIATLREGGSALDAVEAAVRVLEDDPLFNAGTGGSLDEDGALRLDASIMEGTGLRAGAVACLPAYPHAVSVARAALNDGRHLLYAADGADRFAKAAGFALAPEGTMITAAARDRLRIVRETGGSGNWAGGTVGAVARDRSGAVAAATSTGGMVGKRRGRVGDSPIIGAGNYADDATGAASATGEGEAFLKLGVCLRACDALGDGKRSPEQAARWIIGLVGTRLQATGGIILVDRDGRLGLARNTTTMSWAAAWDNGDAAGT